MGFLDRLGFNKKEVTNTIVDKKMAQLDFYGQRNVKYDYTKPYLETVTNKWVNFGEDNLYPNMINQLEQRCGLHNTILNFKTQAVLSGGYEFVGQDALDVTKKIEFLQFVNHINSDYTLNDLINDITSDYVKHNIVYLKLTFNTKHDKVIKVERIEPSKMRVGVDKSNPEKVKKYYYCFDYEYYGVYGIKEYAPYDKNDKENNVQIYRYQTNHYASKFYALPDYSAGANWMYLSAEISNFQKSNIENSINPSMSVKFYQLPANDEEKRTIINGINNSYAGSAKAGKPVIIFSDGKELAPDVEPIQTSALDKQFAIVSDQIDRNICYAHGINPMIIGIKTPGSLGNSTELKESFDIYRQVWIKPTQTKIENIINKLFAINGYSVTFKLNDAKLDIMRTNG
jgi:hypothetical protein